MNFYSKILHRSAIAILCFGCAIGLQANSNQENTQLTLNITDNSLKEQFNSGELQEKVKRKQIDPHTLIHKAILENNAEVIQFLLRHGVDVDYADENGMTPLTIAILNRCDYAVEVLLSNGADIAPSIQWNDMDLLYVALNMRNLTIANLLIDHGVEPNSHHLHKIIQLAWLPPEVVNESWLNLAKTIIHKSDVSMDIEDSYHNAGMRDCISESFTLAFHKNNCSLLEFLINHGANINDPMLQSRAPLIQAVCCRRLDLVISLVSLGADVNFVYSGHGRPLKLALQSNHPEIVQYLLQHGAKI